MFVHLHTHSYFSFLDGIPSPERLAQAAAEAGMPALALTDHHNLTGSVRFYDACQRAGIQPILGLELVVNHPLGQGNLILLAMDRQGWGNLCRLSSQANADAHRGSEQRIQFDGLAQNAQGLICLTGGKRGLVQRLFEREQPDLARRFLDDLKGCFPERLYLELQWQRSADRQSVRLLADVARAAHLPIVATNNVHYLAPKDARLQRTLSAMRLNTTLTNLPPDVAAPDGSHFTLPKEMIRRFNEYPEAVANTLEIAARCRLELPLGQPHYPEIDLPEGVSTDEELRRRAFRGAVQRYGEITPEVEARLEHELEIISARDYAPFFLIVQEILDYARRIDVPISSRGSAASSLVAHCLGITSPDPLALNLYFERFLNPARSSPPDIDTDLCSRRRDEVIRHVYERYGADRVAMVETINRFRRRSALREVAKAHGFSSQEIKALVTGLPSRGWGPPSRWRATSQTPYQDLRARFPDPRHQRLFDEAEAILKFPRHLSVHPGGVVISPGPMTDLVPTFLATKGVLVTQFSLEDIERLGLVKIDLLGTRGLTVLGNVARQIHTWQRREYPNRLAVLDAIPEDDPKTTELVRAAEVVGCFAIESPGMRATLREIDAHSVADIMIALALYRPGPLTGGLKDAFVRRHLGQEAIHHIHPALAPLLEDTYGVILYQEQVLRVASELAGLSLAEADLLRRAMSHFDPGERMKTLKTHFIAGAQEKSRVAPETGEQIWEMMAAFAGYGFPKAHAASYALVAWRSAWCKAHYPAEFMAAVLAGWGGYYRQPVYLNEARRLGLSVRGPHINHSQRQFATAYPDGIPVLYMGLDQVRDLTRRTQKRILQGRPFQSLEDFLTRVDPRPQEAQNLIQVGALDGLGTIPALLARVKVGGWQRGQLALFEFEPGTGGEDWDLTARMAAQKRILGVGVAAHPLELAADQIKALNPVSTVDAACKLNETVTLAGVCQSAHRIQNADGENEYRLDFLDLEGMLPVMVSAFLYQQQRKALSPTQPIAVEGRIVQEPVSGEIILRASRLRPLK